MNSCSPLTLSLVLFNFAKWKYIWSLCVGLTSANRHLSDKPNFSTMEHFNPLNWDVLSLLRVLLTSKSHSSVDTVNLCWLDFSMPPHKFEQHIVLRKSDRIRLPHKEVPDMITPCRKENRGVVLGVAQSIIYNTTELIKFGTCMQEVLISFVVPFWEWLKYANVTVLSQKHTMRG